MIIAIVLSSLALTAAVVGLAMAIHERKRSRERSDAQVNAGAEYRRTLELAVSEKIKVLETDIRKISEAQQKLADGLVPDYEKAKDAAKAVNEFNAGLAAVFGYDPYDVLAARRKEERGEQL